MGPHSIFWNTKKCGQPYEENGCMAPKLSGGPILVKIPNIYCAIYDLTSNEVLMTQKVRKTKFFQWKNGCMTPQLLGGPFLIQIYNIEPFLARAIKTTKVNTVQGSTFRLIKATCPYRKKCRFCCFMYMWYYIIYCLLPVLLIQPAFKN